MSTPNPYRIEENIKKSFTEGDQVVLVDLTDCTAECFKD